MLVVLAVVAGTVGGALEPVRAVGRVLLVPLLLALLTAVFLQVDLRAATRVVRDRRVLGASLVLNFLVAPVAALGLGALLLSEEPDLCIGLVMLLVTPCTDWYLAFTSTARGDVPIATGLLPVNLVLQVVLLPVYLWLLGGTFAAMDVGALVGSVALVAGVPLVVAGAGRRLASPAWRRRALEPRLGQATVVLLVAAVAAMFAWEGAAVLARPDVLVALLPPLALFFAGAFLLAQAGASGLGLPPSQRATLTMTAMARNSPLALGVAAVAFPDRPAIALALVVAPVVELPVLAAAAHALRRREAVT